MESRIAKALRLKFEPVALLRVDEKPKGAIQPRKGERSCVMAMFARAAKGETITLDRETVGCPGGAVGLGFGNWYDKFPGGLKGFYYFLSVGFEKWEEGRDLIKALPEGVVFNKLVHGERYKKSPELVAEFVNQLPITSIPERYVVFKPISEVVDGENPVSVVFVVNPHQLSALIVLANYGRGSSDNVIAPMGAGCHQIGIYVYREAASSKPKAVIGLTDLDARLNVRSQLGDDVLTFAVPYKMFREMEGNVEESFLEAGTWLELQKHLE